MQGVGYRFAITEAALAQGVAGWVRNRRDGTVEAVIQGPRQIEKVGLFEAKIGEPRRPLSSPLDGGFGDVEPEQFVDLRGQ